MIHNDKNYISGRGAGFARVSRVFERFDRADEGAQSQLAGPEAFDFPGRCAGAVRAATGAFG